MERKFTMSFVERFARFFPRDGRINLLPPRSSLHWSSLKEQTLPCHPLPEGDDDPLAFIKIYMAKRRQDSCWPLNCSFLC